MSTADEHEEEAKPKHGPKYCVNIEGVEHPWSKETITVPEIRSLGQLPAELPVLEIDLRDNTERTLAESEIVTLKPGQGFCKKVGFKRGQDQS